MCSSPVDFIVFVGQAFFLCLSSICTSIVLHFRAWHGVSLANPFFFSFLFALFRLLMIIDTQGRLNVSCFCVRFLLALFFFFLLSPARQYHGFYAVAQSDPRTFWREMFASIGWPELLSRASAWLLLYRSRIFLRQRSWCPSFRKTPPEEVNARTKSYKSRLVRSAEGFTTPSRPLRFVCSHL